MSYREDFEKNYIAVPNEKNEKKVSYMYCGPFYFWDISASEKIKYSVWLGIAGFLNTVLLIWASVQYVNVNYAPLIGVPTGISAIGMLFEWIGIVRFWIQKKEIKEDSFNSINMYLKASSLGIGICAAILTIYGIYYLIVQPFTGMTLAVTVCYAVPALSAFSIFQLIRKLPFHSEKNPLRKEISAKLKTDSSVPDKKE